LAWHLTWLLASGEFPDAHGWPGWRFTMRWDAAEKQHIHRLVAPNNVEYSAGEILSWHFHYQRIAFLERDVRRLKAKSNQTLLQDIRDAHVIAMTASSALHDLTAKLEFASIDPLYQASV
jgi:hypothetical protein